MTTEQKVSDYLTLIGIEHSDVKIVKENEAITKIDDVEALIKAIEAVGFTQYNYNDNMISSKQNLGSILINNIYRQEIYYSHNKLNAYIMLVEYPYHKEKNYIHLSNESLAPKNLITTYLDKFDLLTKEELVSNMLEKIEKVKSLKFKVKQRFKELKEKVTQATKQ